MPQASCEKAIANNCSFCNIKMKPKIILITLPLLVLTCPHSPFVAVTVYEALSGAKRKWITFEKPQL